MPHALKTLPVAIYMLAALSSSPNLQAQTIIPANDGVAALLGTGYDPKNERLAGKCIDVKETLAGKQSATLSLTQSVSERELSNALGFAAGARGRYGMVDVSASASYMKAALSSSFSISLNYFAFYYEKNKLIATHEPNSTGTSANTGEKWNSTCGLEVIDQIQRGGKVFFTIRIDFTSSEQREAFAAAFNISGPMAGVSATLEQASKSLSKDTQVVVTALQQGGDIAKLSNLFGASADSSFQFVECSFGKLDSCKSVLSSAIHYLTVVFPEQLKDASGWADVAYLTKPWPQYGRYPTVREVKLAIKNRRDALAARFDENLALNSLAERLRRGVRLSTTQAARVKQAASNTALNLAALAGAAKLCFDDEANCVKNADDTMAALKPADKSDLDLRPEMFSQWCDLARTPGASPSVALPVKIIVEMAKKAVPDKFEPSFPGAQVDECARAQDWAEAQQSLDLTSKTISNIEPIGSLTSIVELRASSNNITDISGLGALRRLKVLDLDNNTIVDASPLASLERLEELRVARNKIRDVSFLDKITSLKVLDISFNDDELVCPPKHIKICTSRQYQSFGTFVPFRSAEFKPHFAISLGSTKALAVRSGDVDALGQGEKEINAVECARSKKPRATCTWLEECQAYIPTQKIPSWIVQLNSAGGLEVTESSSTSYRRRFAHTMAGVGKVLIAGGERMVCKEEPNPNVCDMKDPENDPLCSWNRSISLDLTSDAEIFNSSTGVWQPVDGKLSNARQHAATVTLHDGRILLSGGWGVAAPRYQIADAADLYDPVTNKLEATGRLFTPRSGHQMTLLPDKTVLVTGGLTRWDANEAPPVLDTAEIFDPVSGNFSLLPVRMKSPRHNHRVARFPDGRVLIIAGSDSNGPLASTEIYDPVRRTFTRGPTLADPRESHEVLTLSDGTVLVVGGFSNNKVVSPPQYETLRTAEIFSPNKSGDFFSVKDRSTNPMGDGSAITLGDSIVFITPGGYRQHYGSADNPELFVYGSEQNYQLTIKNLGLE